MLVMTILGVELKVLASEYSRKNRKREMGEFSVKEQR